LPHSIDDESLPWPMPLNPDRQATSAEAPTERALRLAARRAIEAGRIPSSPAARIWGGPGSGASCPICETIVLAPELEFELEFDSGSRQLHIRCCAAWDFERRRLHRGEPEAGGGPTG
jgi:hypothetical protein